MKRTLAMLAIVLGGVIAAAPSAYAQVDTHFDCWQGQGHRPVIETIAYTDREDITYQWLDDRDQLHKLPSAPKDCQAGGLIQADIEGAAPGDGTPVAPTWPHAVLRVRENDKETKAFELAIVRQDSVKTFPPLHAKLELALQANAKAASRTIWTGTEAFGPTHREASLGFPSIDMVTVLISPDHKRLLVILLLDYRQADQQVWRLIPFQD